jgi:hypothetical protein
MTPECPPDPYYSAIEEEFSRRRRASILLSPRDWALIGEWKRAGVPLRIVLQGIANIFDAFDRRGPTARRINSLAYCRQEVLGLHELYLGIRAAEAGRPGEEARDTGTDKAIARYLGRLARRVREAMAASSGRHLDTLVAALARAAAELKLLKKQVRDRSIPPSDLEEALRALDESVLMAARAGLPPEEIREAEAAVEREIGEERRRMAPEAFAATQRALMERRLRAIGGLPRLTLFE